MACIHYKFKNSLDFDSITFDGLHISVRDLKEAIMQRKKLNDTDMDLLIINALNAKAYKDEDEMIPKNASVIVARIPLSDAPRSKGPKTLNAYKEDPKPQPQVQMPDPTINKENLAEVADLVTAQGSEEDKIKAMMKQSTKDFDPANYQKKLPTGTPSPSYICYKCNKTGHFIHNCPNAAVTTDASGSPKPEENIRMKRPTGIPHTFLTTATKTDKGAMSLGDGRYAVPSIDQEAFKKGKKERPPFLPAPVEQKKEVVEIPSELTCLLCKDLLTDAVVIPCCGNSYCDECIRNYLLEDDDHKCPTCHEENVSPDKLIINKSLRVSVNNFKNETLYQKSERKVSPPPPPPPRTTAPVSVMSTTTASSLTKVTSSTTVTSSPSKVESSLKLDTSVKTIDLTSEPEPETPVLDEKKESEDLKGKGIAVLSGRQAVTTTSSQDAAKTTTSYRPAEQKPMISTESYAPPIPIPTLGTGYRPHMPPSSLPNTAIPPPGYRPLLYPPSLVPPPPPFGIPPGFIPPQVSKPLSEHEFYREKKRLLGKPNPLDDYTRPSSEKEKKKSRSKSPRRQRTKSRTRSRSRTPKVGSRSPPPKKRSFTKSRSRSPYRKKKSYSRSRSRSITPRRSRSPRPRTRSLTPRARSRSWTPKKFRGRSRSYTRSRTRSRSRTPRRRRSYSRSPPPRRRSFSRSLTPRRRSFSRSPSRRRSRSPFYRGRARSPGYTGYGRDWSPPPYRGYRSPPARGYSPSRYGAPPYNYGGRDYPARFDQRIYEEIFQEYITRFGLPPPPPPGQIERGMYFDPRKGVYRGGSRSRSRSPKTFRRDRNKDRKDDKKPQKDKKTEKPSKTDKSKSKSKKDEEKSKGKEGKLKDKEEKSKEPKDKDEKSKDKETKSKDRKPDEKSEVKNDKSKETGVKAPEKKTVKKVVKLKDGTIVKKESLALRLKTKTGKSPLKAGKPDPTKKPLTKDGENASDTQLNAINRSGALRAIPTMEETGKLPQKENLYSKSKKNSNLIEINTQHVLPEVKDIPKAEEQIKEEGVEPEPMETGQEVAKNLDTAPESRDTMEVVKTDVEMSNVKPTKESLKKVKVVKKIKKVKKLNDVGASQSDSASDLEKTKAKKKKRVQEINENDENSQDESPAKRLKQDTDDEINQNENSVKNEDQLMLSPPELSKWERDDYDDKSPDLRDKLKKKTEKKSLPRSIIESAEKAITQKQPKPATVASAVVPAPQPKKSVHDRLQKSPIRQNEELDKKSPLKNDSVKKSPIRQQRRVYMDDKKQNHKPQLEEDNRKVQNRESSMQITISSDKNKNEKLEKIQRRVSESEKSDRRRASESEKSKMSENAKVDKRKVSVDEKSENVSKHKTSDGTVVKKKRDKIENENKDKMTESKTSHKTKDADSVVTEKTVNGENSKQEDETKKLDVKKKKYERKESIVDESAFVPDYNEHSDTDAESEAEASSASQNEEEKSDKEEKKHKKHKKEKKHKKNKKHKHKHKKKKHKKHKEETESGEKVE